MIKSEYFSLNQDKFWYGDVSIEYIDLNVLNECNNVTLYCIEYDLQTKCLDFNGLFMWFKSKFQSKHE